jgi:hypothetical protein
VRILVAVPEAVLFVAKAVEVSAAAATRFDPIKE